MGSKFLKGLCSPFNNISAWAETVIKALVRYT